MKSKAQLTRTEAIESGSKRYVGKPCKYGHHSERFVSNKECCECSDIRRSKPETIEYNKQLRAKLGRDYFRLHWNEWAKNNRHRTRAYDHSRRLDSPLLAEDIAELIATQKSCLGCDREFSDNLKSTIDHKTPIKLGGSNSKDNLQLLCGTCNSRKGAKPYEQWLSELK